MNNNVIMNVKTHLTGARGARLTCQSKREKLQCFLFTAQTAAACGSNELFPFVRVIVARMKKRIISKAILTRSQSAS